MKACDKVFCASLIDDFGLTSSAFRVLHHLHRRAGIGGVAKCGIRGIARVCRMDTERVVKTIRDLERHKIIECRRREKRTTEYRINQFDSWTKPATNCTEMPNTLPKKAVRKNPTSCAEMPNNNCAVMPNQRLSCQGNPVKAGDVGRSKGNSTSSALAKPRGKAFVLSNKAKASRRRPLDNALWNLSDPELAELQDRYPRLDVKSYIRPAAAPCQNKFPGGGPMTKVFFSEYLKRCNSDLDPTGLIEGRAFKAQEMAPVPAAVGDTIQKLVDHVKPIEDYPLPSVQLPAQQPAPRPLIGKAWREPPLTDPDQQLSNWKGKLNTIDDEWRQQLSVEFDSIFLDCKSLADWDPAKFDRRCGEALHCFLRAKRVTNDKN